MRLIDLTHTFTANMPVYPGDPVPELKQTAFIPTHGYNDYCLHGGMHVGTHMDAPFHMIEKGKMICDMPVSQFFGRGRLIDARGRKTVTEDLLDSASLQKGDIVLVLTGWYKNFRAATYYEEFPEIDPAFAHRLVAAEVSILGLDTPTPDRPPFPVHKILLSQDVLIIENMNDLELLVDAGSFDVWAVPAKYDCEAAPVRVVAHLAQTTKG
jgi:kynurenine formamidase